MKFEFKMGAVLAAVAPLVAFGMSAPAQAQSWPTKNITIIVPLAAGAGMDLVARLYAEKLQASLGRTVVVENRPGASLSLGAAAVSKAGDDAHLFAVATTTVMVVNPVLKKSVPYNPKTDFTPISLYVKSPFIFVVNPGLKVNTVKEFVALAKTRTAAKSPLSYASLGVGAIQHLSMETLKAHHKIDVIHVPYKSTVQAVQDMAAGHVSAGFTETGAALGLIRDGKLKALAVASGSELPVLPGVKPLAQEGDMAGFELESWHVLLANSKTPAAVVERMHNEMKKIMADPAIVDRVSKIGLLPSPTPSVEGIKAYIASEEKKWGTVVRALKLEGTQ